jgi:hypothetical protein
MMVGMAPHFGRQGLSSRCNKNAEPNNTLIPLKTLNQNFHNIICVLGQSVAPMQMPVL